MRVILATLAPEGGGVGRHMLDLAGALRERGHHVTLGLRANARDLPGQAEALDLPWMTLTRALAAPTEVWHLHLHNTLDTRALPALMARRLVRSSATILTEHLPRTSRTDLALTPDPTHPLGRSKPGARRGKLFMKRMQFAASHRVVVPSRGSAAFLIDAYGVSSERVAVVNNGLEPPGVATPVDRSEPLRIAFVGALHWRKGVDVLLDARAIARRPWHVTVIGDGPARARLESQAASIDATSITFTGWLDDPGPILETCHILAVPSRAEAFSYAPLEAMLRGRAVVGSNIDGLDELIRDGQDGYLLAPENAEALAARLDALADDRATVERLGRSAHERASTGFSLHRMVDSMLGVYTKALSDR